MEREAAVLLFPVFFCVFSALVYDLLFKAHKVAGILSPRLRHANSFH
jgi:hypothetical protein